MRRRDFLLGLAVTPLAGAASARERAALPVQAPPGAVIVSMSQRRLFIALRDGTALSYRVAVGKPGKQWFGTRLIDGKHVWPAWGPPKEVKRDNPSLPDLIPGGAPNNPMGSRALTLAPGEYAIHGTTESMRRSIGSFASYGCVRMLNEDIEDLFERVRIGAPVTMVR